MLRGAQQSQAMTRLFRRRNRRHELQARGEVAVHADGALALEGIDGERQCTRHVALRVHQSSDVTARRVDTFVAAGTLQLLLGLIMRRLRTAVLSQPSKRFTELIQHVPYLVPVA